MVFISIQQPFQGALEWRYWRIPVSYTHLGVELETISTEEAGKRWQQDRLGDLEPIFVLFKNMPMAYKAYKAGFRYATLQVGGIGGCLLYTSRCV